MLSAQTWGPGAQSAFGVDAPGSAIERMGLGHAGTKSDQRNGRCVPAPSSAPSGARRCRPGLAGPAGQRRRAERPAEGRRHGRVARHRLDGPQGGVAEVSVLNDDFTIAHSGALELPFIGSITAAGMSPEALAKQITDRLQARSGLKERPITSVQLSRKQKPAAQAKVTDEAQTPPPVAAPSAEAVALDRERACALRAEARARRGAPRSEPGPQGGAGLPDRRPDLGRPPSRGGRRPHAAGRDRRAARNREARARIRPRSGFNRRCAPPPR